MKRYIVLALLVTVGCVVLWFGYKEYSRWSEDDGLGPAGIVGVQHLGHGYLISSFYLDKQGGGSAGREGGGGKTICCAMIPMQWRPGLTVEIRWRVEDWSHVNRSGGEAGNYSGVTVAGIYIAKVPVEKYENSGDVYVHFFPRGRVRVVSTMHSVLSPYHPVPYGPTDGGPMATVGCRIKEMFSQAELRATEKRRITWK